MSISRNRILLATALGHLDVDLFASLVPILLTQLSRAFDLSNAQIGLAVLAYTFTAGLSQPVFGFFADRVGGRVLAVSGILWNGTWMAVSGFAPSYPLLVMALLMAGLGSGAYHPQGAVRATLAVAERRGSGSSIFFLGGALGFALGPLMGAQLFSRLGTWSIALVSLASLPVAYLVLNSFPPHVKRMPSAERATGRPWRSAVLQLSLLAMVGLVLSAGLRAWVYDSFNAYVPKFFRDAGLAPLEYGLIASVFLIGGSVGGLIGGFLSDRRSKKLIIMAGLAFGIPAVFGFTHASAEWRLPLGFLTGVCLSIPFTPVLMIFQSLAPNRLSTITGLAMTYFFLAGGVGTSVTGVLADRFGLGNVMQTAFLFIVASLIASVFIREDPRTVEATENAQELSPAADATAPNP